MYIYLVNNHEKLCQYLNMKIDLLILISISVMLLNMILFIYYKVVMNLKERNKCDKTDVLT